MAAAEAGENTDGRGAGFWNACYTLKGRRDASAAFLGDDPAESGAMVQMVVGPDKLVGRLLLFGRQAGV